MITKMRGFTLIETLLALAILAVLSAAAVMVLQNVSMSPLIITGGGQSSTIVLLRLLYSCIDVIKSKDFACEICLT